MPSISFKNYTVAALAPQERKVSAIYGMSLGWEVWAQIELGLEMARALRNSGRAEMQFGRFQREFVAYNATPPQRADFMLETSLAHVRHLHFGELKCLIGREAATSFTARVTQDINKVKGARPNANWVGTGRDAARAVTGHVIAITVDPERNLRIDAEMNRLAQQQGIRWDMAPISADGVTIKVWVWSRRLV